MWGVFFNIHEDQYIFHGKNNNYQINISYSFFISVGELLQGGKIDISLCVLLGTTSDPAPFS
jgi:hypothetical protein